MFKSHIGLDYSGVPRRSVGESWRPPFDGFEVVEGDSPGGIIVLHFRLDQREGEKAG